MAVSDDEPFPYRFERALVDLRTAIWHVEELMQDGDGVAALTRDRKGRMLCDSLRQNSVFLQNVLERLSSAGDQSHLE